MRGTIFLSTSVFLLLFPDATLAASEGSWEKLRGRIRKLKTAEEVSTLPGEGRTLQGKGELFPEVREGFVFCLEGGELKISKKGSGKLDTTLKKDFQTVAFSMVHPREKKCSLTYAFQRKGKAWEMRCACFSSLKSSLGELTVFDANVNGRFDDVGTDLIQGPVPEEKPLAAVLSTSGFYGLFHVWASGTKGALWPVSRSADAECVACIAELNVRRGRGGLEPVGFGAVLYGGLVLHTEYMFRNNITS
ncbi:MAG: hypothetical protein ACYS47_05645, partial [Planctomycetota bacterium]